MDTFPPTEKHSNQTYPDICNKRHPFQLKVELRAMHVAWLMIDDAR
jgi:hypothetical protein